MLHRIIYSYPQFKKWSINIKDIFILGDKVDTRDESRNILTYVSYLYCIKNEVGEDKDCLINLNIYNDNYIIECKDVNNIVDIFGKICNFYSPMSDDCDVSFKDIMKIFNQCCVSLECWFCLSYSY